MKVTQQKWDHDEGDEPNTSSALCHATDFLIRLSWRVEVEVLGLERRHRQIAAGYDRVDNTQRDLKNPSLPMVNLSGFTVQ